MKSMRLVAAGNHLERLGIDQGRREPVFKSIRLRRGREEERVLAALGPQPEPLLAAEDMNVLRQSAALGRRQDAGFDVLTVNPTETRAVLTRGGRGHHPALPRRSHSHLRAGSRILEHVNRRCAPAETPSPARNLPQHPPPHAFLRALSHKRMAVRRTASVSERGWVSCAQGNAVWMDS